jgi:phosphoribosylformimino-5-aminoimidazole carboxamide ribonucleotide (ProFAR) isomerase
MIVIPAIDIRAGRVVRLKGGVLRTRHLRARPAAARA